jgi:predicted Zn-dependent peptidase
MTTEELVQAIKQAIADLPQDQQAQINKLANAIRIIVETNPGLGRIALGLVGAEYAA